MNKQAKKIVAEAWQITHNHRELLKYGFFSSLFSILFGGAYILYQFNAFRHSKLFSDNETDFLKLFSQIGFFVSNNINIAIAIGIFVIMVLIGYFFVPILCSGALTHLISKIYNGEPASHGLSTVFFRLLPMMETLAVKGTLKPVSFFTEWSFVIRNLGPGPAQIIMPVLIVALVCGIIALFLFVFTTQMVILKKTDFTQSIVGSSKLVLRNVGKTISLFLIFLLIELRVILNVAVIVILPLTVLAVTGVLNQVLSQGVGLIIALSVGVILIILTAFITGTLYVFGHAIWTVAFIEFQKEADNE